jgi:hypothetical protein
MRTSTRVIPCMAASVSARSAIVPTGASAVLLQANWRATTAASVSLVLISHPPGRACKEMTTGGDPSATFSPARAVRREVAPGAPAP